MNWIEKVEFLINKEKNNDYDQDKFSIYMLVKDKIWQEGEFEEIIKDYDFIPESYIIYMKKFNGTSICNCAFYGPKYISTPGLKPQWNFGLKDYVEEFRGYSDIFKHEYFPFAKNECGGVFAINRKQEIILFDSEDFDFEEPIKLADSFEEFIGECLLGKKFADYSYTDDNKFYDYLKHLGWV